MYMMLNPISLGFLNYYDACSEGLQLAHPSLQLGGPAESLRKKFTNFSLALLQHCANGINYFTRQKGVRINFISLHEKVSYSCMGFVNEF